MEQQGVWPGRALSVVKRQSSVWNIAHNAYDLLIFCEMQTES